MSQALNNLLTLLNLEKLRKDSFADRAKIWACVRSSAGRSSDRHCTLPRRPSRQTVWCTPFTAIFCVGDSAKPIVYDVEVLRDGNSFSARRVAAIQNGKPIFYMTASFRAPEPGYEHQKTMPAAPSPDDLKSETDIARALAHLLPPQVRSSFVINLWRSARSNSITR